MNLRRALALLLLVSLRLHAAETPSAPKAAATAAAPTEPAPGPATIELQQLVDRIQTKLKAGKDTAADLADELTAFDRLVTKYGAQKNDETAQILYMQGTLYTQVLNDNERALQIFRR